MKKRFLLFFITLLFIISFIGCEKKEQSLSLNITKTINEINKLSYEKDDKIYPLFTNMVSPSDLEIEKIYNLDITDFNELVIKQSAFYDKSNLIIIANVKNNKIKKIKKQLESYMNHYEQIWKDQDKTQYNLVLNRSFYEKGNYLIYVISYDNNNVIKTMDSMFI